MYIRGVAEPLIDRDQPCNRPDTRRQQQTSQSEDTCKEYCQRPEGNEE